MFMLIGGFLLGALILYISRADYKGESDMDDWGITALTGHVLYYGCSLILLILFLPEYRPNPSGTEYIIAYLPVMLFGVWLFTEFKDLND